MAQRWEVSSGQTVFTFTLQRERTLPQRPAGNCGGLQVFLGTGAAPGNGITGSAYISRRHP